jgi:hypothetical protein
MRPLHHRFTLSNAKHFNRQMYHPQSPSTIRTVVFAFLHQEQISKKNNHSKEENYKSIAKIEANEYDGTNRSIYHHYKSNIIIFKLHQEADIYL